MTASAMEAVEAFKTNGLKDMNPESKGHEKSSNDQELEQGVPNQIYTRCLMELRSLCLHRESTGGSGAVVKMYWDELAHMSLWGKPFANVGLEIAVQPSDKLKSVVLSLLKHIAETLLTCA